MAKDNYFEFKKLSINHFEGVNSKVGDNVSKAAELSHAENIRSNTIGFLEKRKGSKLLGNILTSPANYGLYYFDNNNSSSTGLFRITDVSGTISIYYLDDTDTWTSLADADASGLSAAEASFTIAENNLFIANGTDSNRYIKSDGITVTTSADSTGHLYNSPIANKISYYKDRLYLADYTVSGVRYPTSIMRSSYPLGIMALVNNDVIAPADNDEIKITETKYVYVPDTLDVYRGSNKVATINIDEKGEDYIKLNGAPTFETGFSDILSADEIWPTGSHGGEKIFRWATSIDTGIEGMFYDSFKLTGGDGSPITLLEPVAKTLLIANNNNLAFWNGNNLQTLDVGIGCVSKKGYTKAFGSLFFLHYTGIYAITDSSPEIKSSKVDEYIEGATTAGLENAVMGSENKSIFCYIGDVTLYNDDNSINKQLSDVVLEYDIQQQNWFVHTDIPVKDFVVDGSTNKLQYINKTDGHVYTLLSGLVDKEGVDNEEIPCNLTTSNIYFTDSFEKICYPREIIVEIKSGHNIKCFISLDDREFRPLEGTLRKGCNILNVGEVENEYLRGRKIKISLREMSGSPFKVSKMAIMYSTSGERENHTT